MDHSTLASQQALSGEIRPWRRNGNGELSTPLALRVEQEVHSPVMKNKLLPSSTKPQNKVVSFDRKQPPNPEKPQMVACDVAARRIIFGIGQQRIAVDLTTHVTRLAPGTGDVPAPVLPLKKE
jgi:hypothetical protein